MQNRRINVRGIILEDGKLFAQKFKLKHGGETDFWGTPGGGLDIGETLQVGLRREMIEETGVEPTVGKLLFIQQFNHHKEDGTSREELEFFFHIENVEDYEKINLSETSHGDVELTKCGFVDVKTESILPTFLADIDIQDYIANDKPVHFYTELDE